MQRTSFPTYIINLKKRVDRREHIEAQFAHRSEFDLSIVNPVFHENGAFSLWMTIQEIIQKAIYDDERLIIICEDDHQFTDDYFADKFISQVLNAERENCEVLSGGVSCVKSSLRVNEETFWMEDFTGLQFTVLFKASFRKILDYKFEIGNDADIIISSLADDKRVIYPFISVQKEFGYSDVTPRNAATGHVENLFKATTDRLNSMDEVLSYYKKFQPIKLSPEDYDDVSIPVYFLMYKDEIDLTIQQFADKPEFDVRDIFNVTSSYVSTIKTIVEKAIETNEEILVLCRVSHIFSEHYNKTFFFRNLVEAHYHGADIMLGHIDSFDCAVPISESRFWIMSFRNSNLIVLYKNAFNKILKDTFQDINEEDTNPLSWLTSNKMLTFPFVSSNQYLNNKEAGLLEQRLKNIKRQFMKKNILV